MLLQPKLSCPGHLDQTIHRISTSEEMRRRNLWSDTSITELLVKRRAEPQQPEMVEKILESRDPVLMLFAPKFVCHTALSWELGWKKKLVLEMIQELSSCGRYRTNPQVHTKRRMQPDVRSCSNDIHPTSREKAINPTKEQPGTQFSKFQLKHFHVHRREVRRMMDYALEIVHGLCMWLLCIGGCAMSQLSHVEKFPGSECCGFWRVDQGVFISTRVHIWRH